MGFSKRHIYSENQYSQFFQLEGNTTALQSWESKIAFELWNALEINLSRDLENEWFFVDILIIWQKEFLSFSGFNLIGSFASLVSFASLQTLMGRLKTLQREERMNLLPSVDFVEGKHLARGGEKEENIWSVQQHGNSIAIAKQTHSNCIANA